WQLPSVRRQELQRNTGGSSRDSLPSQRHGPGEALHLQLVESWSAKSAEESQCESEDGMEDDAVISDCESAEDSEAEEGEYSEEENSKVELKSEGNDAAKSLAKEEKGEEKPDTKGSVIGERQIGDGQESTEPVENKVGKKGPKHLDDDEDGKNPAYTPERTLF
ncbi:Hypothetical predicted protein, partial [Marmota monax]